MSLVPRMWHLLPPPNPTRAEFYRICLLKMSTSISTPSILSQVNHVFCYVGASEDTLRCPTCSPHQADHENMAENSWITSHDPWSDPGLLGVSFILGHPLLPGYGTPNELLGTKTGMPCHRGLGMSHQGHNFGESFWWQSCCQNLQQE